MHIIVVGINHKSASIDLRERLAFKRETLPDSLQKLKQSVGLSEAAILSTCNRIEVYGRSSTLNGIIERLKSFLSEHANVELSALSDRTYSYTEPHSIQHLFGVASGLDSMIIGEAEIQYQVKQAYEAARQCGATGKVLNVLFQKALNASKAVRSKTSIGYGSTSIGTIAVELSQKIFSKLDQSIVLLIGAGKVGELTLRRLTDRGARDVRVMNRSVERAAELVSNFDAHAVSFQQLSQQLVEADIVISSTSAAAYVLSDNEIARAMQQRHQRPLCIVDLGVPRNVDPQVSRRENVYLFDIDDLQGLADHNYKGRQEAVRSAHIILGQKVNSFLSWWNKENSTCVQSSSDLVAAR